MEDIPLNNGRVEKAGFMIKMLLSFKLIKGLSYQSNLAENHWRYRMIVIMDHLLGKKSGFSQILTKVQLVLLI